MTIPVTNFFGELIWSTFPQQIVDGLLIGSIYALIALGYTMVYGVLKLINFAHGEVFMLGGFVALFVSWKMGYRPTDNPAGPSLTVLLLMLLASIVMCALIGMLIERFAYRPLRSQPRIASLITAIGVSLLIQYGGQIVLPTNPIPSIDSRINPFNSNVAITLRGPSAQLLADAEKLKPARDEAESAWKIQQAKEKDPSLPSEEGKVIRRKFQDANSAYTSAHAQAESSAVRLDLAKGKIIMFATTLVLMFVLKVLVMNTKPGRAMRAVSLDFNSASLMGINVDSIVTFTFLLGSGLAGAGAMMNYTFIGGSAITTFSGITLGTKAFVAAVLGGIGNIPGAVLGGFLMGMVENLVIWGNLSGYKDAIAFVILIVVLIFKPGGLLGSAAVDKV